MSCYGLFLLNWELFLSTFLPFDRLRKSLSPIFPSKICLRIFWSLNSPLLWMWHISSILLFYVIKEKWSFSKQHPPACYPNKKLMRDTHSNIVLARISFASMIQPSVMFVVIILCNLMVFLLLNLCLLWVFWPFILVILSFILSIYALDLSHWHSFKFNLGMVTSKAGKRHALTGFEALQELFIARSAFSPLFLPLTCRLPLRKRKNLYH